LRPAINILKIFYIAVLLIGAAIFFSCREKIEIISSSISNSEPTLIVKNFVTTYSDSANLQLRISAPLMKSYGKVDDPYSDFDEGLKVDFFEGGTEPTGQITSKFARYLQNEKLWEVRDSVVAINSKGEVLETELLYWDEEKDLIYTDKFVRITQDDQIITGRGLESDPRFSEWIIKNVTATLYLKDE
jgi:LPS export ABC transporter protein LptC